MVLLSDELEPRSFHELFSGLFVPHRFGTISSQVYDVFGANPIAPGFPI
jgi:hypothetical protein